MATITEGFRAFLLADAAIAAIVGERVHHGRTPQASSAPWIAYRRVSRRAEALLDGSEEDIVETHFAAECVAETADACEALADLVRARLNLFKGDLGGFAVLGVFVEDVDEEYSPFSTENDDGLYLVAWDVAVMHV